jgi:hypothetical protein
MLRNPLYPPTSRDRQGTSRAVKAQALLVGVFALLTSGASYAACSGPGAPTTTQTKCVTAIAIPGNPVVSFDISWVNPDRAEFYLADRSNSGIDIIDTKNLKFKRTIPGFVGAVINPATNKVVSNASGPDGVVSHGHWLYAGDGNSTLKVIDLDAPTATAIKASISTGGTTRLDEMAMTPDGKLLLAANNAEDPPFGTLFHTNGDNNTDSTSIITKITVDASILPQSTKTTPGLSIEQPVCDPTTERFYVAVPQIKVGSCTLGAAGTCPGGLLVINPKTLSPGTAVIGAFDASTNTGVLALNQCGPNGAAVGPHDNLLLGCTPANITSTSGTLVINAKTKNFANIGGITGSDEVWFNPGDKRYYTGSSANIVPIPGVTCPDVFVVVPPSQACPALGVINGVTNLLIETIPQGSGSHSLAADAFRNLIFVPQVVPLCTSLTPKACPPGAAGADTTATLGNGTGGVSAGICGTNNGCVAVYKHDVDEDEEADLDHDRDHGDRDHGDRDR